MKSSTRQGAEKLPCGNYYIVVRCDGQVKYGQVHRGENTVGRLLENLKTELEEINKIFKNPAKKQMTPADWQAYDTAEACHICGDSFLPDKVESHCRLTGSTTVQPTTNVTGKRSTRPHERQRLGSFQRSHHLHAM